MYRTICTILRYETIYTIHTLYRKIHEHLRYVDTIQNFLHTIRYISYDMYCVSYDTDNYSVEWDFAVWPPEHHWISTTRTSWLFLLIANHRDWLGFIPLSLNQEQPWLCVHACTCVRQGQVGLVRVCVYVCCDDCLGFLGC